jgi:hypothetical protein
MARNLKWKKRGPGANPTIASYNAEKSYSTADSLARFEAKLFASTLMPYVV